MMGLLTAVMNHLEDLVFAISCNIYCWYAYMVVKRKCFLFVMLQVRRSGVQYPMMWMHYSINLILPAPLWSWGWVSLQQRGARGNLPAGKGQPVRQLSKKCGSLDISQSYRLPWPATGVALPFTILVVTQAEWNVHQKWKSLTECVGKQPNYFVCMLHPQPVMGIALPSLFIS
jgi:hypothetical protein